MFIVLNFVEFCRFIISNLRPCAKTYASIRKYIDQLASFVIYDLQTRGFVGYFLKHSATQKLFFYPSMYNLEKIWLTNLGIVGIICMKTMSNHDDYL